MDKGVEPYRILYIMLALPITSELQLHCWILRSTSAQGRSLTQHPGRTGLHGHTYHCTRWVPNYSGMMQYLGKDVLYRGCVNMKNNLLFVIQISHFSSSLLLLQVWFFNHWVFSHVWYCFMHWFFTVLQIQCRRPFGEVKQGNTCTVVNDDGWETPIKMALQIFFIDSRTVSKKKDYEKPFFVFFFSAKALLEADPNEFWFWTFTFILLVFFSPCKLYC